ncbi:C4-dicarboxylate ABC transporter [Burkholderia sp. Nafp2/4-1b]|uniref:TDT family transporter n=1 Tax=Burkholderia sp. Nafp2/4-1b TaxID=2116686 RepID=UPI000EF8C9F1|nr:TDT family transporter [Burkholderia sp. Nafp2/4-1b]RKT99086.1 C4-dicarboxylate ABC transporter [Burkholderia sp. Nafp2/4-1b]
MKTLLARRRVASPPTGLIAKIRQFTPNWFAVTMGTGIVFLVLNALPFDFSGRDSIAMTLWCIDIVLYLVFAVMFAARWILFPSTILPMLRHPLQSMFLGALPMGLVPIINGIVLFAGDRFGTQAYSLAHALWWFDAVLAVVVAVGVPYLAFTTQDHAADRLSAVLLLPIVAPEVAASSAATLAPHLDVQAARVLVGAGYMLWAISVPLAFGLLTIIFFRLLIHKLPARELAATGWLPLGPIGTGALGLLALGRVAPQLFDGSALAGTASFAQDFGLICALMLWGTGFWWLAIAILITARYCRNGLPFNLGWWGFTFPLGVYTLATFSLSRALGADVLLTVGVVFAMMLGAVWIVVLWKTLKGVVRGELFVAPCLSTSNRPLAKDGVVT